MIYLITVLTNSYDEPRFLKSDELNVAKKIAFVDDKYLANTKNSCHWSFHTLRKRDISSILEATCISPAGVLAVDRLVKLFPFPLLDATQLDTVIYTDSRISISSDYLRYLDETALRSPWVAMKHRNNHNSFHEELFTCLATQKIGFGDYIALKDMASSSFFKKWSVAENGILCRKPCKQVIELSKWWLKCQTYITQRDQLSLPFAYYLSCSTLRLATTRLNYKEEPNVFLHPRKETHRAVLFLFSRLRYCYNRIYNIVLIYINHFLESISL